MTDFQTAAQKAQLGAVEAMIESARSDKTRHESARDEAARKTALLQVERCMLQTLPQTYPFANRSEQVAELQRRVNDLGKEFNNACQEVELAEQRVKALLGIKQTFERGNFINI